MSQLKGKVALVTGASKGMGKAIATRFAQEGAQVAVTARSIDAATRVAEEIGVQAIPVALEVSDAGQWQAAVNTVTDRLGKLTTLVNCAGITEAASLEQASEENWRRHMNINLDGVFHGCKAALPAIKASGEPGSIVNISSMFALRPVPGFIAYCTSKAAMTTLTQALALECAAAGYPIRVNSVHPGGTATDMLEQALAETGLPREDAYKHFIAIHPMQRMGTVNEVAAACLWLASEQSSFTTGMALTVDGGGAIRA